MRILGIAPKGVFSGFENSFFDAVRKQGADIDVFNVDLPLFKLLCTFKSVSLTKSKWGLKRDLAYHTSIQAFQNKSRFVQSYVLKQKTYDAVYQIGGLWNPIPSNSDIPLVLSVDYTSLLSEQRGSEWKRKPGAEREFWIEQEVKLFQQAKLILATTHNARKSIITDYGISPDKIHHVGPGVSAPYDELDEVRFPAYDSKRILFIGKGFKGKGLDTLLEAFKIVKKSVQDAVLTVIGPSTPVSGEGVEYLGRIGDKNLVKEWYYKSAVFAMPSIFEPVGQVFLEAMSCKLPCIGTTLDAMPELIDDSGTGFTIEPGDYTTLADHLIEIITNESVAHKMGNAGFKKLKCQYTWDVVGSKIYNHIKNIINE